jgi:hypothetical protein
MQIYPALSRIQHECYSLKYTMLLLGSEGLYAKFETSTPGDNIAKKILPVPCMKSASYELTL